MEPVYTNPQKVQEQLVKYIYRRLPNRVRDTQLHRQILLGCMDSGGYIINNKQIEQEYEDHEPIINESETNQVFIPSYEEMRNTSTITGTLIQPTGNSRVDRLLKTQTYGGTSQETELAKLSEKFDDVLSKTVQKFPDLKINEVKMFALDMYTKIKNYYKSSNRIKGEMKGDVMLGYKVLVVYYALVHYNVCVTEADIVAFFDEPNINLSILPRANGYMRIIFGEILDTDIYERCLFGMTKLFDNATLQKIKNGIKQQQQSGAFHIPALNIEVAVAIRHYGNIQLKIISEYTNISNDIISLRERQYFSNLN